MTRIDDLIADFEILDEWEDRYRHVIELGRALPPLPAEDHTPGNKVQGCASQVWITSQAAGPSDDPVMSFRGDSDALIVKGLIAIAFMLYADRPAREILATDAAADSKRIRILTIAPLIGEAVRRIADESSVSSLFD